MTELYHYAIINHGLETPSIISQDLILASDLYDAYSKVLDLIPSQYKDDHEYIEIYCKTFLDNSTATERNLATIRNWERSNLSAPINPFPNEYLVKQYTLPNKMYVIEILNMLNNDKTL